MEINVGSADKIIRIVVGAALILLSLLSSFTIFQGSGLKYGAIAVGAILIVTALFKFCPLYRLLGIRTCKV